VADEQLLIALPALTNRHRELAVIGCAVAAARKRAAFRPHPQRRDPRSQTIGDANLYVEARRQLTFERRRRRQRARQLELLNAGTVDERPFDLVDLTGLGIDVVLDAPGIAGVRFDGERQVRDQRTVSALDDR